MAYENKVIGLRVEQEYLDMLEELERIDGKDAATEKRVPMNRTQLIKQAIREYYAARTNHKAMNAYVEIISNEIRPMFEEYLSAATSQLAEKLKAAEGKMDNYNALELSYLKLFLACSGVSAKDSNFCTKALSQKGAWEDPVISAAAEFLKSNR